MFQQGPKQLWDVSLPVSTKIQNSNKFKDSSFFFLVKDASVITRNKGQVISS